MWHIFFLGRRSLELARGLSRVALASHLAKSDTPFGVTSTAGQESAYATRSSHLTPQKMEHTLLTTSACSHGITRTNKYGHSCSVDLPCMGLGAARYLKSQMPCGFTYPSKVHCRCLACLKKANVWRTASTHERGHTKTPTFLAISLRKLQ